MCKIFITLNVTSQNHCPPSPPSHGQPLTCTSNTGAKYFPPYGKKNGKIIFFQKTIRIPPPKWICSGIASTKKRPRQKGLAGLPLSWASYNLQLKHWCSMHSPHCKSTLFVFQKPTTKIWIQPSVLNTSKDCSHTKEARTERFFWPLHPLGRYSSSRRMRCFLTSRKGNVIHIQKLPASGAKVQYWICPGIATTTWCAQIRFQERKVLLTFTSHRTA